MSNETLLYICGIVLAVSAVTVSFVGLKVRTFPGKAMPLVVLWFAIFVGGAATFAVLHAKDEDADKAKEARFEKAGEEFERAGGHVNGEAAEEPAESPGEEGEGHSEEGSEEAGAEESPESAEEGAEEECEKTEGAGAGEAGGGTKARVAEKRGRESRRGPKPAAAKKR
jgi:hypothetical protein